MKICLSLLALVALGAAGCGSHARADEPTTTRTMPIAAPPMPLTVFRVRRGILHPTVVRVPRTRPVAAAALDALGLPARVTIAKGTAAVDLPRASDAQAAEIVFTLTQLPAVERVDVAGRTGLTRSEFRRYMPPILVLTPSVGATVAPTFHVSGTASVFEATLVIQLFRNGKVLAKQSVMASEGAPGRGPFHSIFHATQGPLVVQAFSPSAVDGSPQHEVDVSVTVRP